MVNKLLQATQRIRGAPEVHVRKPTLSTLKEGVLNDELSGIH